MKPMNKTQYTALRDYLNNVDFSKQHNFHELYVFWLEEPEHQRFTFRRFTKYLQAMGVSQTSVRDGKAVRRTLIYNPTKDSEALRMFIVTETCPTCQGRGELVVDTLTDKSVVK